MNKAYSLTELMTGLFIGVISIGFLLQMIQTGTGHHLENKSHQRRQTNLEMSAEELDNTMIFRENSFWESFPVTKSAVHPCDYQKNQLFLTRECPDESHSGCLVYYDMEPANEALIYRITTNNYPTSVSLQATDPTIPAGLSSEADSMSVLLVNQPGGHFCILVSEVISGVPFFAAKENQPWLIPETLDSTAEIILLGHLSVTHVGLVPVENYDHKLIYRPWVCDSDGWQGKRSRSSFQHLNRFEVIEQTKGGAALRLHSTGDMEGGNYVTVQ
ncbi:MAG: hypothetical protein CSA81_00025 [Acidobacteria bacterium]|nr:MAG: hypothetical protein CSA81_00025 [Acidobacteriota bacterium]PIE91605.1 MAG: hypothetical protein CR997_00180 [Acidobacteriota bacterium]